MVYRLTSLLIALISTAGCLRAQSSEKQKCESARLVIASDQPRAEKGALDVVLTCGKDGAEALALGFTKLRSTSDSVRLDAYLERMQLWRDASLFRAALSVAGDRNATERARVIAFGYLRTLVSPGEMIEFDVLGGGLDAKGLPRQPCARRGHAGRSSLDGAALPAGWRKELQQAAWKIYADTLELSSVRSAAFCST